VDIRGSPIARKRPTKEGCAAARNPGNKDSIFKGNRSSQLSVGSWQGREVGSGQWAVGRRGEVGSGQLAVAELAGSTVADD